MESENISLPGAILVAASAIAAACMVAQFIKTASQRKENEVDDDNKSNSNPDTVATSDFNPVLTTVVVPEEVKHEHVSYDGYITVNNATPEPAVLTLSVNPLTKNLLEIVRLSDNAIFQIERYTYYRNDGPTGITPRVVIDRCEDYRPINTYVSMNVYDADCLKVQSSNVSFFFTFNDANQTSLLRHELEIYDKEEQPVEVLTNWDSLNDVAGINMQEEQYAVSSPPRKGYEAPESWYNYFGLNAQESSGGKSRRHQRRKKQIYSRKKY